MTEIRRRVSFAHDRALCPVCLLFFAAVAVEVKSLHSAAGRQAFLDALVHYKAAVASKQSQTTSVIEQHHSPSKQQQHQADSNEPQFYKPFGGTAICCIGFPSAVQGSFGRFGSAQYRAWKHKFRAAGIPVHCVVLHSLNLMPCR